MPDGDKFERRLPGKAWRQAYRLACRNDDFNELVRLVRDAAEQDLRNGLACPKFEEIANLVHKALGNPLFASLDSIDREWQLTQQLDAIVASQLSYPGTRLAIDAAKSVYAKNDSCQQILTIEQVREQLSKELKARLIDNRFLSRVREGVRDQTGLNNQEQVAFEKRLVEAVISYKSIPRRIQSQPTWDLDHLNQPIPVMEA
jgi:uncharacterized protein with von Willebrand factor type A (vWA) domain